MDKTNAMRILDSHREEYQAFQTGSIPTDGKDAARQLGADEDCVFKTLVTVTPDAEHFVFVLPVSETLDLKKAAKAVGVKSVSMLPQKALFPLTGYVHGGCSPIGMKKAFVTVIDETALLFDEIYTSAGKLGVFLRTSPASFERVLGATFMDIVQTERR